MKVLYVIDSLAAGGAESALAASAPALAARGVNLEVAYFHDRPGLQAELLSAGAGLHLISGRSRAGRASGLVSLIQRLQPDLVHTTLFEADLAGRAAAAVCRVPAVTSLVNPQYGPEQFSDPRLSTLKLRAAQVADIATARLARRFHAITSYVADVMSRRLMVPRGRIEVIPRGRDPQVLGCRSPERARRARAALGVVEGSPLVLAAARQEYQKGLDVLLEAAPEVLRAVPGAVFVLAGRTGNDTPRIARLLEDLHLGERVRVLGARRDVHDLMAAADVLVVPSRWEGLGSVVIEAMALQAPLVASDIPAVREVVSHRDHALLVPPERSRELAAAIVEVLTEPAGARLRAAAARRRFLERFTLEAVVDQTVAFYERSLRLQAAGSLR